LRDLDIGLLARRLGVLAGLADQRAQLLRIGGGVLGHPGGQRVVVGNQPVAPLFGQVQLQLFGGRALVLLFQGLAGGVHQFGLQLAHELAHVLHLAALAFKVGDALGLGQRFHQFVGQAHGVEQVGAQGQQLLAQVLQFIALAFEIGAAGIGRAFEFGLELNVQFAAFGNKMALHKVAFFGFA